MREYYKIRIEGPEIHVLLSRLSETGINMRKIRYLSDVSVELICEGDDYRRICAAAKNRYIVHVLKEYSRKAIADKLRIHIITAVGAAIFILIIFYQSLFVSRIEINGLETIPEESVTEVLRENGIYPGCRRGNYDLQSTEFDLFDKISGISWMELHDEGGIVFLDLVEEQKVEIHQKGDISNIVAAKSGIIEEVIVRSGDRAVREGQQVNAGDLLITGRLIDAVDKSKIRYVNSSGEVYARCFYSYQKREKIAVKEKQETGHSIPGLRFRFGDFEFDTSEDLPNFDSYTVKEKNLIDTVVPLPIKVSAIIVNETENVNRKRTTSEILRTAEKEMLKELKKNAGKDARIAKKYLQFSEEENIIVVNGLFETIEEIGREVPVTDERTETEN